MPIYLIVPLTQEAPKLDAAVERAFPQTDRYKLPSDRGWLVHFSGTTVEASNHVGISKADEKAPSETEAAIVTLVPSYFGRARTDLWEWLYTRMNK